MTASNTSRCSGGLGTTVEKRAIGLKDFESVNRLFNMVFNARKLTTEESPGTRQKCTLTPLLRPELRQKSFLWHTPLRDTYHAATKSPAQVRSVCSRTTTRLCVGSRSLRHLQVTRHRSKTQKAITESTAVNKSEESQFNIRIREWAWLPDASEVRRTLGGLEAVSIADRKASDDRKRLVVITLEVSFSQGVVCDYQRKPGRSNALKFRPEAFSALSYLQLQHFLVFVTRLREENLKEVVQILAEECISPDAVYRVNGPETTGSRWGFDYSQVYSDFRQSPHNCLVVSTVLCDYYEHPHLTDGRGILRSYVNALPVPTSQYPQTPVVALIPHMAMQDQGSSSMILLSLLINAMSGGFACSFPSLSFDWIDSVTSFPYRRLWLQTFDSRVSAKVWRQFSGKSEPVRILVIKRKHIKPNFEVGFRRGKTPMRAAA